MDKKTVHKKKNECIKYNLYKNNFNSMTKPVYKNKKMIT